MVAKLFAEGTPDSSARVLDPGCGTGVFIDGVIRFFGSHGLPLPHILGIDTDPMHVASSRLRFASVDRVEIRQADFLDLSEERFDFILGNPPYVAITGLSVPERDKYRRTYITASGRFDLYLLFFEQALRLLRQGGRLVFVTPEKYLYVATAAPLRMLLNKVFVEELDFLDESTFDNLVTYPLVTTVAKQHHGSATRILLRTGERRIACLPTTASSWMPAVLGGEHRSESNILGGVASRVSCGIATGADSVFVLRNEEIEADLLPYAHPTIAGRDLRPHEPAASTHSMLVPYDIRGQLLPERLLGYLGQYLGESSRRERLMRRTCVNRKPWYAFHETPPLRELLRPKLLCKDIAASPFFVADEVGALVPRHSVYYVVPADPNHLQALLEYLNSSFVRDWLQSHCQRAANGFLRLQSHVLKQIPMPESLAPRLQDELFPVEASSLQPA
jgi:SAM-dependent methyltransferase